MHVLQQKGIEIYAEDIYDVRICGRWMVGLPSLPPLPRQGSRKRKMATWCERVEGDSPSGGSLGTSRQRENAI